MTTHPHYARRHRSFELRLRRMLVKYGPVAVRRHARLITRIMEAHGC